MSEATTQRASVPEWTIGWKLKRALDFAGLSAQEMANELGVHVGTVSRWMNDRETPRRAYVIAWAMRCGIPFDWFTDESEEFTPRSDPQRPHCGTQGGYTPVRNEVTALAKPIVTDDELAARLASGIRVSSVLGSGQVVNS